MTVNQLYTDHELFAQIAKDNEQSFSELFKRYDKRIYPFVLKMIRSESLAEEITQEIFIKIWNNRSRLVDIDRPDSYILTLAARHTLDHIKKRLNEKKMLQRLSVIIGGEGVDATGELMNFRDSSALLQQAIDKLPAQQKKVFLLSREEGLNYQEIGERMSISGNTVRNHLVEALRSIRSYLDRHNEAKITVVGCMLMLIGE